MNELAIQEMAHERFDWAKDVSDFSILLTNSASFMYDCFVSGLDTLVEGASYKHQVAYICKKNKL